MKSPVSADLNKFQGSFMAINDFGVCLEAEKGQKTLKIIFYANNSTSDVKIVEESVIMLTVKKNGPQKKRSALRFYFR